MNNPWNGPTRRLPDTVAARVLERAAQLDSAADRSVSLDDLRAAAADAGISAQAMEQALREIAGEPVPAAAAPRRQRHWMRPAAVAAAAVAAALMVGAAAIGLRSGHPAPGPETTVVIPAPPPPVQILVEVPPR